VLTVFTDRTAHPEVLVLCDGFLLARDTDALGRRTRQQLARIASLARARYTFDRGMVSYQRRDAGHRRFSLAGWARSHFEAQLDAQRADTLVTRFTGVLLSIAADSVPDPGICDATDLRILDALSTPQRLDQVWHHARTPRFRLLAFLHFLSSVDALELCSAATGRALPQPSRHDAHRVLGVAAGADQGTVKRAYRRLARALHPDMHPQASAEHRRRLSRRLAAVTHAYSELSG
jgi:DnaJ-domain-containing protein 1